MISKFVRSLLSLIVVAWVVSTVVACAHPSRGGAHDSHESTSVRLRVDELRLPSGESVGFEPGRLDSSVRRTIADRIAGDLEALRVHTSRRVLHGTLFDILRAVDAAEIEAVWLQIADNRPFPVANGRLKPTPKPTSEEEHLPDRGYEPEATWGLAVTAYPGELHLLSDGRYHPESPACEGEHCHRWEKSLAVRFRRLVGGGYRRIEPAVRLPDSRRELGERLRASVTRSDAPFDSLWATLRTTYRWQWLQRELSEVRRGAARGWMTLPDRITVAIQTTLPVVVLEYVRRSFCPPSPDDGAAPPASHELALSSPASCRPFPDAFLVHALRPPKEEE